MSSFNFMGRFVPMVEDWSKIHTIRSERKNGQRPGQWMHLYTGLRHKGARLLMLTRCTRITCIGIEKDFRIWIGGSIGLTSDDSDALYGDGSKHGGRLFLDQDERAALAWRDGFRPEHSTLEEPGAAYELMCEFWEKDRVHSKADPLPFFGVMSHWNPAQQWKKDRYGLWVKDENPQPKRIAGASAGVRAEKSGGRRSLGLNPPEAA